MAKPGSGHRSLGPDRITAPAAAQVSPGGAPQRSGNWRRAKPAPFLMEEQDLEQEKAPLLPDTVSPTDSETPNGGHGGAGDAAAAPPGQAFPMLPRAKTTPVIGEPTNNTSAKPRRRSSGGPGSQGRETPTGAAKAYSSAAELRRIPETVENEPSASTAPIPRSRPGQASTAPQLTARDSPYQVDGTPTTTTSPLPPSTGGNSVAEAQTAAAATPGTAAAAAAGAGAAAPAAAAAVSLNTHNSELPHFGTAPATNSVGAGVGSGGERTMSSPPPPGWVVINSPHPARNTMPAAIRSDGTAQSSSGSRGRSPPLQAGGETTPPRARSTTPTRRSLTPTRAFRSSSVPRAQGTPRGQGRATAEATSAVEAPPATEDTSVQPPGGGMLLPPIALATADDNVVTAENGGENTTTGMGGINSAEVAESSLSNGLA